jgi:acyl-coenzyme A synthetase/AMP-(fatty) acid ligase
MLWPARRQPLNVAEASAIVARRFKSRARRGIRLTRDANLSVSPALYKAAMLINTSGTTGQPQFVIHTPETLSELADLIVKNRGLSITHVTR